jgi:nucleotide-binding universal stress UspA family protein
VDQCATTSPFAPQEVDMERTRVLVPLDGSTLSAGARPYADAIARAMEAPLRLLAVVEREPGVSGSRPVGVHAHLERGHVEGMTHTLETTATEPREHGLRVSNDVVIGDPVDEILAAADQENVRMTMMANHGRGGFQPALVGSVADKEMRLNAHPTFLIRSEEQGTPGPVSLRRLMVLLESSPLAEAAVPVATDLAGATSALLVLVRVRPFATPMWLPDASPEAITEMVAADVADAEQYVAGGARRREGSSRVGSAGAAPVCFRGGHRPGRDNNARPRWVPAIGAGQRR